MIDHNSLRYYRIKTGLSQKELAQTLHIATNTLSDYENGKVLPNMMMLQDIFRALGYSLSLSRASSDFSKKKDISYLTQKTSREINVKPDMEIYHRPYLDFIDAIEEDIENNILSSVWEFVDFVYRGEEHSFLQNGIQSNDGKIYIRLYKFRGSFVVKKAIFENNKLIDVLDEWATLEEVNNNMYNYLKYRYETEVQIADSEDELLTDIGNGLFSKEFHEKYIYGLAGEI